MASEPYDGASLPAFPGNVVLRFDEPVGLIAWRLVGPNGTGVSPLAPPAAEGQTIRATYKANLPQGGYVLSYRVTSADGHAVAGAVAFGVGRAARAAGPAGMVRNRWEVPSMVVRWLFYLTLMVASGGLLFRALVADPPAALRRSLQRVAAAGTGLAALQLGLRGALLADAPLGGLVSPATWRLAVTTSVAPSLALSCCGLLAGMVALGQRGTGWRLAGVGAAVAAVAGLCLTGHAATASPRWTAVPLLAAHTLAVAFWLGAFWPLLVLAQGPAAIAGHACRRFSRLAVPCVVVLVGTGVGLAALQLGHWDALLQTQYGILVMGKLGLLAVLILLAAWNRNRLTPALLAGAPRAALHLRASIAAEAVLAAVVLALTAALTFTPPPRAQPPELPLMVMAANGPIMAHVELQSSRPGTNRISVSLMPPTALPKEVWLELTQKAAGAGPIRRRLVQDAAGAWSLGPADLAIPGRWTLRIELLMTEYDVISMETEAEIH